MPHEFNLGDIVETLYLGDPVRGAIIYVGESGYSIAITYYNEANFIWRSPRAIRLAKEHYLDKFQAAL